MPMVDKKKFPYTAKGKKEAKQYAMKSGKKMTEKKTTKKVGTSRGY
jgi:glutamate racemase